MNSEIGMELCVLTDETEQPIYRKKFSSTDEALRDISEKVKFLRSTALPKAKYELKLNVRTLKRDSEYKPLDVYPQK